MTITRSITVRFAEVGFHRWPEATGTREYLSSRHRHMFHIEATVTVEHNDREVEFHDLLDYLGNVWPGPELDRKSCEDIGMLYIEALRVSYPGRTYRVSVWEDNEVGATVEVAP